MALFFTGIKNIWLADDEPDDCELFSSAIYEIIPSVHLNIFSDGLELLQHLDRNMLPDILFLDINMPSNGFDCLKEIRDVRGLKKLPVVIFSGSLNPQDMYASYGFGANLYYPKPTSFSSLLRGLEDLLQMNWDDPYTITSNHYLNNTFIPYTVR
ncbi:MAG TPA: response regulator [Flavisolibacter sp.]|jgi:CheY-like chemotaxis protein|nr:response regulator [Flavisolibacter sp.]